MPFETCADPTDPCDLDTDGDTVIADGGQLHFDGGHRTDCCHRLIAANIIISQTANEFTGIGNTAQPETGNCHGAAGNFITVAHANDFITICEFEADVSARRVSPSRVPYALSFVMPLPSLPIHFPLPFPNRSTAVSPTNYAASRA